MPQPRAIGERLRAGWSVFMWEVAVVAAAAVVAILISLVVLAIV